MTRRRWMLVVAVVAAAVLVGWWVKSRSAQASPKYRTAAVERGAIESLVSATGTVRPVVQVEVGSQVSGTVQRLFADYNSRVRAGQVLCQLDPSSFRARAVQAEAAVSRAEAALKESRRQLGRARELIAQNYVSQAEVDAAEVAVEQREAELKQARAQVQAAHVDLANTTIRSPIDGVVIARSIDLGQTVAASLQAPKLFVIANDLARMQVETRIDEADIGLIHPGLPVRFTVDAFPDFTFSGRVAQVRLEPIVEQGVVTYTTIIHTENPDLRLRPGMTANVSVRVAEREDAMKVPNASLRFRPPEGRGGSGGAGAADGERMRAAGGGTRGAGPGGGDAQASTRASGGGEPERRFAGGGAAGARPGADGAAGGRGSGGWGGAKRPAAGGVQAPEGGAATSGAAPGEPGGLRPGTVYVLRDGKPVRLAVMTGLTDGAHTEVVSDGLLATDRVIVGLETPKGGANLQPPPGMGGGPGFGGGGGRGAGGGGRGGR